MSELPIPFNRPFMTGKELGFIEQALQSGHLAGDGPFTKRCHDWLRAYTSADRALLTHSCTAALELSALLLDLEPGDEIILPSYTFVSTANAFVLQRATPVFVDIRPDTLNIDEGKIADAITSRTRAIVPVHYAGVSCEMDAILKIASDHGLAVIEDAAQGVLASYHGRPLGAIGDMAAYSFHETKNIISGEGGAFIANNSAYSLAAEIAREKGTNRAQFFRGEVDKYSWQSVGSSFLPSELAAAFLWAQLDASEQITQSRIRIWARYHELLASLEGRGLLRRPTIPDGCEHNAHMYYVVLDTGMDRDAVIADMKSKGIHCAFHYVPLHSSSAGKKFGRAVGPMNVTDDLWQRLMRLPMWTGLEQSQQERIVQTLESCLVQRRG